MISSAAESGLERVSDPELLERAAEEGRILVSHDRRTMLAHFRARPEAGKSSPGVFVVSQGVPLGPVVNAIVLTWSASERSEWQDQVHHLPTLARRVFASYTAGLAAGLQPDVASADESRRNAILFPGGYHYGSSACTRAVVSCGEPKCATIDPSGPRAYHDSQGIVYPSILELNEVAVNETC